METLYARLEPPKHEHLLAQSTPADYKRNAWYVVCLYRDGEHLDAGPPLRVMHDTSVNLHHTKVKYDGKLYNLVWKPKKLPNHADIEKIRIEYLSPAEKYKREMENLIYDFRYGSLD